MLQNKLLRWPAGAAVCAAVALSGMNGVQGSTPPAVEPPKPILYDWLPDGTRMADVRGISATKYTMVYQNIAPDRGVHGIATPSAVIQYLRDTLPSGFRGWGVFDFEGAFGRNIDKGPDDPDHRRTVDSLVQLIRSVKREWPESRWTFWGYPTVRYWIHDSGEQSASWASASAAQKARELERAVRNFRVLANEVDWLTPWIYDVYPLEKLEGSSSRLGTIKAQQQWARAKVNAARRCSDARIAGVVPVIPMFCPIFAPGGTSTTPAFVPIKEFVGEALKPAIEEGVDGLATWNGFRYQFTNAFRKPSSEHHLKIRDDARHMFNELLFPRRDFEWDSPNAKARLADLLRQPILEQLESMRSELNDLPEQSRASERPAP